ncbi:MAG: MazG family protein [Kiritimatiellae bacterium]|jgi:MazG family protein|nr:MazG family protein [Kiritimatiellia bacterium]
MNGIERLHAIMTTLRDPEKGCPWDKVQTLETLKPCVLEETYELLAAMDNPADKENHIEELGDVLLQVMFQSVMAEEKGEFSFDDVANAVSDKLVHRHPHVFGDVKADDPAAVLRNWERIKQSEHRKSERRSALDGVPKSLPALLKARRTLEKASRTGYTEEMKGVEIEGDPGEFLFRVVNSIAAMGVDSEAALEKAVSAFSDRFKAFEERKREE